MLLGNADVEIALREALLELDHARALAHGRRDADQARVLRRHVAQPLTEDLGKAELGRHRRLLQPDLGVELARAVVGHRIGLGQLVALALFGYHVQELRSLEVLDVFQRRNEGVQVVPVNRADVVEAELFKQRRRHHHALGVFFQPLGEFEQRWRPLEHGLAHVLGGGVELAAHELRQITVQRPHGRADAHIVVIQDDQQIAVGHAGVVQRLKRHAGGHGTVADDGNAAPVFAAQTRRQRHAQGGRNRGAGMRRAKGVVGTFGALWEPAQSTQLAQTVHAVAPPGEDLVRVGLVAHVPHQAVMRGVEDVVQRHGELDRAQIGTEVAAGTGHAVEQKAAQLVGQLAQALARQLAQVRRVVDGVQQRVGAFRHFAIYFIAIKSITMRL